ncbi:hypothetical protein FHR81_000956 [Actinoalloteichus hoggarensis]|uniref:Uncharacterized protein n=1 Tax=Actinoalloteichus hoggarensis TaxID=1470176 RepID=A0A221VYT1_9PSEU|nr:hypothetical protein [Actinoalloteichus hoggarensis]ASO18693.1 hypothetical protein AHOG_05200 [Actinoalloteichus hoggarensis]MBB5919926.1 hypothetical protein [Actinoalloteichus hoggarensis]
MDVFSVGTFNYEDGGLRPDGRIDLDPLIATIAAHPVDVLMLGECPQYPRDGQRPLWEAVGRLSDLLGGRGRYLPFYARWPGHRHHPCLLVNSDVVEPVAWHDPEEPDVRAATAGFLYARVLDVPIRLAALHWSGAQGRAEFDIACLGDGDAATAGHLTALRGLLWEARQHLAALPAPASAG